MESNWVDGFKIKVCIEKPKDPVMLEREARVLEMLLSEGLIE